MKSIQTILSLFFVIILQYGFSQSPIVTYDFNSGKFDTTLPFDQHFQLKLVNIDTSYKKINITIKEIPNTKEVIKKLDSETLTNQDLLEYTNSNDEPTLKSTFEIGDNTTQVYPIVFQLKHNSNYFFQFEYLSLDSLSTEKKQYIEEQLEKYIEQDFNAFLQENFKKSSYLINGEKLNSFIKTRIFNYRKEISSEFDDLYFTEWKSNKREELLRDFQKAINQYLVSLSYSKNTFTECSMKSIDSALATGMNNINSLTCNIKEGNKETAKEKFDEAIIKREALNDEIKKLAQDIAKKSIKQIVSDNSTYSNSPTQNAKSYFTFDVGFLYSPYINDFYPTTTFTIYFRPINKNLPFKNYSCFDQIMVRTGFVCGLTTGDFSRTNRREGIINNQALILGLGFRILPFLQISAGSLVFKADDPNPIIENFQMKSSLYFSASIDFDIKSLLSSTFTSKK